MGFLIFDQEMDKGDVNEVSLSDLEDALHQNKCPGPGISPEGSTEGKKGTNLQFTKCPHFPWRRFAKNLDGIFFSFHVWFAA